MEAFASASSYLFLFFLFIYFYAIYIYIYIANYGNLLPVASPSSLLGVEGLYLASHSFEISYEIQQLMSNIVSKKNIKKSTWISLLEEKSIIQP